MVSEESNQRPIPPEVETIAKQYIGKRVRITDLKHPHYGSTGTVDCVEFVGTVSKWGFVVKYDNKLSGFVFSGKEWVVLNE